MACSAPNQYLKEWLFFSNCTQGTHVDKKNIETIQCSLTTLPLKLSSVIFPLCCPKGYELNRRVHTHFVRCGYRKSGCYFSIIIVPRKCKKILKSVQLNIIISSTKQVIDEYSWNNQAVVVYLHVLSTLIGYRPALNSDGDTAVLYIFVV